MTSDSFENNLSIGIDNDFVSVHFMTALHDSIGGDQMTCLLLRNNYNTLKLNLSYFKEVKNVFSHSSIVLSS